MNRFIIYIFSCLIITLPLLVQSDPASKSATEYLNEKNEVYFSFERPRSEVLQQLLNIVSVCHLDAHEVKAYANAIEYELFLEFDIPYQVLRHPGDVDFNLNMKTWEDLKTRDLTGSWDFYPTYEAYVALMYQFEADYPDLVEIINIGQSVLGRDLLFARISPQPDEPRPVPQFMYTSTMHGDETAGFILSLRLIHYLITNYDEDEAITDLMNSVEIFICPNENPDGTYRYDNSTVSGATRSNINGIDLNRNYPNFVNNPWQDEQPETTVMRNFTDTLNFIMSANMHGGIELVNFPFDSWTSSQNTHADHDWWEFVMHEYVDTVHAHSTAGYMTSMGGGVTHGGDWYVIYGSRQDYFNYYKSCREFTLELSNQKLLNPALLPAHWNYNYRSMLNYIRQSTYGVHGLVYDNGTGEPIWAEVAIPGYDAFNSEVSTSMPLGNYNRPLLAGNYTINYSAPQFASVTISDIDVNNYETTRVNIALGEGVSNQLVEVAINKEGSGYLHPFEGTQYVNDGANLFLYAEADASYSFEKWVINGNEFFEDELVYTLDGDVDILAVFSETPQNPVISVSPEEIAFGQGVLGGTFTKNLYIQNLGLEVLEIYDLYIEGDDVFMTSAPVAGSASVFSIDPGEQEVVPVFFMPVDETEYSGTLYIESNDPDQQIVTLPVSGTGVSEAAIISLVPDTIDFDEVFLHNTVEHSLSISNVGNLDLVVEAPELSGDEAFSFDDEGITWPYTLEPDDEISLMIAFSPVDVGSFEAVLLFESNAGNDPAMELYMKGIGKSDVSIPEVADVGVSVKLYPNPINEQSRLVLELDQPQEIEVSAYDIQGRHLLMVHSGMLEAGRHQLNISGACQMMDSGVFLFVIRTEERYETIRVIKM